MRRERQKSEALTKHVFKSTLTNYFAKLVTFGTWFLLTPFILHRLGPTGYGIWVLVGSVVAYGSLFGLGISGTLVKFVAQHRVRGENNQARRLIATALCLYSVLGLIAIALGL